MPSPAPTWTETLILTALHMRDHEHRTASQIGAELGFSRSSVLGVLHRIKADEVSCSCVKAENRDGGMPALWWKRDIQHCTGSDGLQ